MVLCFLINHKKKIQILKGVKNAPNLSLHFAEIEKLFLVEEKGKSI